MLQPLSIVNHIPSPPGVHQTLEIAFQLSPGLYGAPRTLALARAAQDLAAASGVFLPTSHHLVGLLELLHAREGRPCPAASGGAVGDKGGHGASSQEKVAQGNVNVANSGIGSERRKDGLPQLKEEPAVVTAAVDLSAVAGLGKEDLRLGEVHAAVSRGAAGLIAREAVCYRWSAGLPELCAGTGARLGKLLEGGCLSAEGGAGKCRARVRALQVTLGRVAAEAAARRARGSKHPGEAGPIDTFRGMVSLFLCGRFSLASFTSLSDAFVYEELPILVRICILFGCVRSRCIQFAVGTF